MRPVRRPARLRVLEREQVVRAPIDATFRFFSEARNLETITPPWLRFRVVTPGEIRVATGTTIDYEISTLGLRMRWRSVIERFEPGVCFVDRMLEGPYRWWSHFHGFEPHAGGTRLTDRVEYAVPGGPLAPLVHAALVRRRLASIFDFRRDTIAALDRAGRLGDARVDARASGAPAAVDAGATSAAAR